MSRKSKLFTTAPRQQTYGEVLSVRVPDDMIERLADVGNAEGLSLSDTVRLVLERGLQTTEKSPRQPKGGASWRKRGASGTTKAQ